MWSRKPMPVVIVDDPDPSRSIATSTSVSLVVRLIEPLRMRSATNSAAFYQGAGRSATYPDEFASHRLSTYISPVAEVVEFHAVCRASFVAGHDDPDRP